MTRALVFHLRQRVMLKCRWLATFALVVGVAVPAEARITRVQIVTTESPTFGGYSWPGVGQYEKIVGKAFGEVDPGDPKNALIADIGLAPRNADGNVEYSFDFYILKPIDLTRGAHKVMYEPPNRGGKTWANFGRYRSLSEFYKRVTTAIDDLVKGRLMLCEDAVTEQARLLKAGLDAGLSSPDGKPPRQRLKHCR